jgi:uncharacterized protein
VLAPHHRVMHSDRLARLPAHALRDGLRVVETGSFGSRLLGLALLGDMESDTALLIRRCRSVHTLGMMFPIDVVFLDRRGEPLRTVPALRPGRLATCRTAHAVLETPVGRAAHFLARGAGALAADPAQPLPTSRRRRKVSADSASSSVTFT